jgi:hypothetical protein
MRLLTKYSLISIAALAIVVFFIGVVGVRTFDNISRESHGRLLDVPISLVANDIEDIAYPGNEEYVRGILNFYETRHGTPLLAFRRSGDSIYPADPAANPTQISPSDIDRMLRSARGSGWIDTENGRHLVAWRVLPESELLLVSDRPESVVYS